MMGRTKAAVKAFWPEAAAYWRGRRSDRLVAKIESILNRKDAAVYCDETIFEMLQERYPSRDEYRYDRRATWTRGMERAAALIKSGRVSHDDTVVEIGCGDGMVAAALKLYGCQAIGIDIEDWRDTRARGITFFQADPCSVLPLSDDSADLSFSFNTFEHLKDPVAALREIVRVTKPGGTIYLDFNPIYASAWGLHAYRTIHMPYAQFLFAPELLKRKIAQLGLNDLGRERTELQPLNEWRVAQFDELWRRSECEVQIALHEERAHIGIICEFPAAFQGRDLTTADVITSGMSVTLRKPIQA